MTSLRILHLVSYPLYSGPMPHVLGLAKAQRAAGNDVWIGYDTKRGNFDGFEEEAQPYIEAADFATVPMELSAKSAPLAMWRDAKTLLNVVRERRIDVVHAHMSHDHVIMAMALRDASLKKVVRARTVHAARSLENRFGQRMLLTRADTWIVRSQAHSRDILNRFRLDASRVHVVPGSVDASVFAPRPEDVRLGFRRRFDLPDDALLIAHVALIAPGRGQEELVRTLAQMGDAPVHAMFVGRGESEHTIRELARALRIAHRVHFAGYIGLPELVDVYAAADLAFVGRPGNDAASRAALEAMACGKPVIALREGALAETVTDRVGYPVSTVTPELITRALRNVLDDREDALVRGRAARELVLKERTFAREVLLTRNAYLSAGALPANARLEPQDQ